MSKSFEKPSFQWHFLHPKYALIWLGIGLLFLLSCLPYKTQRFLGFRLGRLMMKVLKTRRLVAERNLELCFPEKSESERNALLIKNFESAGMGVFETGMAWFWPKWRIQKHLKFEGLEHLKVAQDAGKGVLIVVVHTYHMELAARAFGTFKPGYGVYRPNENPMLDWIQTWGRTHENTLIDRKDVKQMIRCLRQGELLWYAPDHDYGHHRYTWAPFFAVDKACTTTGTHMLVSAGRAFVATYTTVRNSDGSGYTMRLDPMELDFPEGDVQTVAEYTNKLVERSILQSPDQYMWLHRRFKSRPEGEESLYDFSLRR